MEIILNYVDNHPKLLIDNNRWDIAIKFFYVTMFRVFKGDPPDWLNEIYKNKHNQQFLSQLSKFLLDYW